MFHVSDDVQINEWQNETMVKEQNTGNETTTLRIDSMMSFWRNKPDSTWMWLKMGFKHLTCVTNFHAIFSAMQFFVPFFYCFENIKIIKFTSDQFVLLGFVCHAHERNGNNINELYKKKKKNLRWNKVFIKLNQMFNTP